jgi:putative membrane-bound dehydrogenase-like protein
MSRFPLFIGALLLALCAPSVSAQDFRAGAAAVDITPTEFPVIVNGGFLEKQATKANDALFARGAARLGITGTAHEPGRLFIADGFQPLIGKTTLRWKDWHHIAFVRCGEDMWVYLDGKAELGGTAGAPATAKERVFGHTLEGRIDEAAVFDRALTATEIQDQFDTSGVRRAARTSSDEEPAGRRSVHAPPRVGVEAAPSSGRAASERSEPAPSDDEKAARRDNRAASTPPLSPEESLRKIHLPAGWKIELLAAEPDVVDPVAFDWDERGRLWVVEMADYPLGLDNAGKPGGRIRVLTDTDDDGRYDTSTLFADGLSFPNGLLTWRDGVIVTAAPNILFLRDTNADGKADEQSVLVSGLQEGNQQLRANGLRWGLDNWVYVAAGGHHGKYGVDTKLRSLRSGEEVLVGSRDFRFRPDSGRLEPASGPTQFGRNRDNWGRWFGTQNSNPLWHYVLPDHYLRRNPHVGAAETRVQLLTPANPPVFPASPMEKRFHSFDQSGHFTSACGGMIVRDARVFPAEEIHAFVCEPFHNLVQHARLTEAGVTFTATRVPGEKEFDFFASEDRWCRPVMVREGPDGALWIADMYRYMIEHPQFLPPAGKDELLPHYRAGEDRGRIYRVSRTEAPAFRPVRLDRMSAVALVAALDSPSGWVRDKAQQVLLWRDGSAAVAPLRAVTTTSSNPLARLHALCTLHGMVASAEADLGRGLRDAHPGVRENALRIAEGGLGRDVLGAAVNLASDPDAKVRLQLAFTLGASPDATAGKALANLLRTHGDNPMMLAAVMSSATPHLDALAAVRTASSFEPLLATALGVSDRSALAQLLAPIFTAEGSRYTAAQLSGFARLLGILARSNRTLDDLRNGGDALGTLLTKAGAILAQARDSANQASVSAPDRIAAAGLLGQLPASRSEALGLLAAWLDPRHPADVQSAAMRALGDTAAEEAPAVLAKAWPSLGPASRQAALAVWMSREPWALDLVQRLERAQLPLTAIDAVQRARLAKHDSGRVRNRAAKLFSTNTTRSKVLEDYRPALTLKGDTAKGREVFLRACAVCHRRGADGKDIGPDLFSVIAHPPEKLLASILDPNADIQPGFNAYTCTLKSGEQLYGLVAAETANSVTLKLANATTRTVLRTEIVTLQSQNTSLMPDGLEAAVTTQDMADLIAFLKGTTDGR